jgi:hypothetical protein
VTGIKEVDTVQRGVGNIVGDTVGANGIGGSVGNAVDKNILKGNV